MENSFMEAMQFRHACKIFDESKKISTEDIETILEAGRISPSSFGIEPWKFLVITNQKLKEEIRPHCWNQVQITSCSHLVVVLAAIESPKVESGSVEKRFQRWGLEGKNLDSLLNLYAGHLKNTLSSDENIYCWSAKQTYLAAANMMSSAAYLKIDSCPIEGFDKQKVEEVLKLDRTKYQLSIIIPFGYRLNPQSAKTRLPSSEVIEYIS